MLHDVMTSLRDWRRRSRTRAELERLDPRLRADIGLPPVGDVSLAGSGWLAELHFRR